MGFLGTILFADRGRENDHREDPSVDSAAAQSPEGSGEKQEEENESQEFRGDTDKLLECPCLDGMKQGPCGPDFLEAFKCFILSKEPEKGADCEANFTTLETCLMANNDALKDAPAGRQKGANIPKIPPKAIKLPPTIGTWPPPE
ncbi:mitochondrial intermembrane space import and assembly protein 40 [Marchantia polymorpha subsp. ruderalis]|uniref:CHCH domain-containing protein n=1 Tax=Marchantia polymorpha TaxID=3197 RepID=A0A2R6WGH6_MARPO|nr:hypothetical protein MARPO_0093s0036 [Marchantia polymorpha]|eukprot:PTQ32958.1 hypothetical protein MARPO_0093s0036 [Marchantia polymorpha]